MCFLDSPAGSCFVVQNDQKPEETLTIRFHDEECKAFSDHSQDTPVSFSWKEPLQEVTIRLLDDGTILCRHLLSFSISSYDETKQCPFRTKLDVYRVLEGTDAVQSATYVGLFDVSTPGTKTFGEYILTDTLQIERPLPHVINTLDRDIIRVVNAALVEAVERSGRDFEYIRSLGLRSSLLMPQEANSEQSDDDDNVSAGLDI